MADLVQVHEAVDDAQRVQTLFAFVTGHDQEPGRKLQEWEHDESFRTAYQTAHEAFSKALYATVAYVPTARSIRNDERAKEISELWRAAAKAMGPFDYDLSNRALLKGSGWLNPQMWSHPLFKDRISIDKMTEDFMAWNEAQGSRRTVPRWFAIAGVVFAVLTFGSLFYLLIGPELQAGREIIFDTWVAFCVACSAAFLGGDAVAKGKIPLPFFKDSPVQFSITSGIAAFVIVFLIMYGANHV
jgi:hypothetical protein